jgi:hypothetical protein
MTARTGHPRRGRLVRVVVAAAVVPAVVACGARGEQPPRTAEPTTAGPTSPPSATGSATTASPSSQPTPTNEPTPTDSTVSGFGFTVDAPPAWVGWTEGVDCKVSSRWLVVTNTEARTHRYVIRGETCEFREIRDLPADVVVVELVHFVSDARGLDDVPSSLLSLFAEGEAISKEVSYVAVSEDPSPHSSYTLRVWIGKKAPGNARALVAEILRSLVIERWA